MILFTCKWSSSNIKNSADLPTNTTSTHSIMASVDNKTQSKKSPHKTNPLDPYHVYDKVPYPFLPQALRENVEFLKGYAEIVDGTEIRYRDVNYKTVAVWSEGDNNGPLVSIVTHLLPTRSASATASSPTDVDASGEVIAAVHFCNQPLTHAKDGAVTSYDTRLSEIKLVSLTCAEGSRTSIKMWDRHGKLKETFSVLAVGLDGPYFCYDSNTGTILEQGDYYRGAKSGFWVEVDLESKQRGEGHYWAYNYNHTNRPTDKFTGYRVGVWSTYDTESGKLLFETDCGPMFDPLTRCDSDSDDIDDYLCH